MKNILKIVIIIIVLFCINFDVHGFVKAKYAGEFMASGVDARPLGMGGAYIAVSDGVSAAYWNPAGLANIEYPQIMGMYAERFAKIVNFNYGAIAIPTNNRTLAISFIRLGVDDIYYTKLPNQQLELGEAYQDDKTAKLNIPFIAETFSDAEWAFYLSYAKKRSDNLQCGANVKIVTKQVWHNSAWGIGFDFGMLYRPDSSNFSFGVNFQDATTTLLAWDTGKREAITPTLKTGAAYLWDFPKISSKLIPALDLDIRFENRQFASQFNMGRVSFDTHLGLEYEFKERVAVRVGLPDVGKFTAGAGIYLRHLNIDYAFMNHELGDTHRISLQLTLDKTRFEKKPIRRKK